MADGKRILGGFGNDQILWFILIFLFLFCGGFGGLGGVGGVGYGCKD